MYRDFQRSSRGGTRKLKGVVGVYISHTQNFYNFFKTQPKSLIFSDLRIKIKKSLENIFFGLFSTRGIYIEVVLRGTSMGIIAVVFLLDKEIHSYKLSIRRRWAASVTRGTSNKKLLGSMCLLVLNYSCIVVYILKNWGKYGSKVYK